MEYVEKLKNTDIPVAVILTKSGCTYTDDGVRYVSGHVAAIRPEMTGPVLVLMGEDFNDIGTLRGILEARPDTVLAVSHEDGIEFLFNNREHMDALRNILDLSEKLGARTSWEAYQDDIEDPDEPDDNIPTDREHGTPVS